MSVCVHVFARARACALARASVLLLLLLLLLKMMVMVVVVTMVMMMMMMMNNVYTVHSSRGFNQGITAYTSRQSRPMHRHLKRATKGEEYLHNHSIFYVSISQT